MVPFGGWEMPVEYRGIVAEHMAVQNGRDVAFEQSPAHKADEAEFIMLKDGLVEFEGNAAELRASSDAYIREFLS